MKLGIFAKTFNRPTIEELFQSIAGYGINSVQFNLACAGLDPIPQNVPSEVSQRIADSAEQAKVELSAVSGTFNMAHPDPADRSGNLINFEVLCDVAATLQIPVITLCTGTRDPVNMWKWHPENDSKEAWDDLVQTMESALVAAERNNLKLAFEPESENIVNSATRARKLLNELRNPRLQIVIDPANLISPGCNQKEVIDEAFALLGDSIVIAHAKDRNSNFQACAAGKGILDFEYYLRCAKQSGFTGPLIMHGLDEIDVAFAREFLHRTLANVGFTS
ncbi:MAG TPA: sugar phosphate isomerase/epimerase [Terrimicrobiaceae bacterium]